MKYFLCLCILYTAASFLKQYSETAGLVSGSLASVVIGYWGQPPDMTDNIHPFLCVPGYLKSESGESMYRGMMVKSVQCPG